MESIYLDPLGTQALIPLESKEGGELSNLICIIAICISVFTAQLLFLLAPWPMSGYAIWKTWVLVAFHNSPMKYAPRFGSLSETSLLREVIAAILVAGYSV